ncbi:hypothetical protein [Spirosoma flavum]|uniref:Uncharacterized protein n=1 Tax=Spirosoma flavum TaxID=2048557 RepID=A0ABW6AP10_9BACT
MIISENSPFDTIDQPIRQLAFDQLLDQDRLTYFLYRKLVKQAGLLSIDELCQQYGSVQDFVDRNKGTGKRVASDLVAFLMSLEGNDVLLTVPDKDPDNSPEESLAVWPPEIASLSLELLHRQGLLSNILFNKLFRDAKLQTVGDFHQQFGSITAFRRKTHSVGQKVIQELTAFFENLSQNPAPYLKAIEKEKDIYLPLAYSETDNVIDNFKRVVDDVKQILHTAESKTDRHYACILEYFFIDKPGNRLYTMEEVGVLLQLHKERVRQLKKELVNGFADLVQKTSSELVPKCFLTPALKQQLNTLFEQLKSQFNYVVTETQLLRFFGDEQIPLDDLSGRVIDLLFDMYGINRCGKVETNFTEADFYSLSPEVDHKSFMVTANLLLDVLKDEVVPLNRTDIIIRVNKSLKSYKGQHALKPGKIPHHFVDTALAQLPEIETVAADAEVRYQIRYPFLTSISARAERILFEIGGRRSLSEVIAEMQNRTVLYQLNDNFEEPSIRSLMLAGNGRVRSHGKLGIYEWVSKEIQPAVNAQSRVELVKMAIENKGEAASLTEIEQYVNAHLTAIDAEDFHNVKSTSATISYLIGKGELIRLARGNYILKNWGPRYAEQVATSPVRNPKGQGRAELIDLLSKSPDQTMPQRVVFRQLLAAGYKRSTVNSTLFRNPMLELFKENNISLVRLKTNYTDFYKTLQQDQVLISLTDLLLNTKTQTLPLPVIIQKLQKEFSFLKGQKSVFYKIVSANPHLFEKSESIGGQKSVTLLAMPKSSDVSFEPTEHWPDLKNQLIEKLTPRLSGMLVHSLDETLDVFFNVAILTTDEADLEALDLLPAFIWKFFSGMADEHFEHSLVREIATSIEPYLLKILYLTAPAQYQAYQSGQTKGLGQLRYLLNRVQFGHSQRLRDAFSMAKRTRDSAAHTARSWSSAERSERVIACLVQMLYSVHAYFSQLRSFATSRELVA